MLESTRITTQLLLKLGNPSRGTYGYVYVVYTFTMLFNSSHSRPAQRITGSRTIIGEEFLAVSYAINTK